MHRFSSASAGCSSALLITIQADWAKRETSRDTPVPPPRGKTRVEWHGGASVVRVRTWRELCGAKNESANRRCGKRAVWCEGEKEYETEQLKLGTVPACAYNIRQKFVNASRDLPALCFSPPLAWHKSERYLRTYRNGILPLVCRCYARFISAVELCNGDF